MKKISIDGIFTHWSFLTGLKILVLSRVVDCMELPTCNLKGLCRHLSMRILGAKFKFSVGHGKFIFPPLCAEIASSGRIPVVSFAIETIIAVDLKLDYSSKKFCVFFDRYAEKCLQQRQKCEDLSADRCFLLSMPYFFVFAGVAGTFLLDCWAWYCHKKSFIGSLKALIIIEKTDLPLF